MNKISNITATASFLLLLIILISTAAIADNQSNNQLNTQSDAATLLTMHKNEQEYNPRISPDGTMFLAVRQQGRQGRNSYNSRHAATNATTQWALFHMENGDVANNVLAVDQASANSVRWLDNNHISFVANRAGGLGLWRMRADGVGAITRLQRLPDTAIDALVLSDGGAIVVLQDNLPRSMRRTGKHNSHNTSSHLIRILADGSSITLASGSLPALSQDGKFITFTMIEKSNDKKSSRKKSKQSAHIFTIAIDGNQLSQITFGEHHDMQPVWHPDGKTLFFVSDRGESSDNFAIPSSSKQQKNWDIWQTDIAGINLQRLTKDLAKDGGAVVAGDGSRILFHSKRAISTEELKRRHMAKGKNKARRHNASHIWTFWLAKDIQ